MLATCVYASFVYFGHLPWLAFGNMVAKTDALHHWATCSSAFPHNKQTKS